MPGNRCSACGRATSAALAILLLASLVLPAAALGAEPSPTESPAGDPTPAVSSTSDPATDSPTPTDAPDATDSAPTDAPPTPEPIASPEPQPTPEPAPATERPSPDPTAPPTSGIPTPAPRTASPRVFATASESLNGYRYTTQATALYSDRDTDSTRVLDLGANAQVSVTESTTHGGAEWVSASSQSVSGYVPGDVLSMTSAPQPLSVLRWTKQTTYLYDAVPAGSSVTRLANVGPGTRVQTDTSLRDHLGRWWVSVSYASGGQTYRGFQLWATTTTLPVRVTGVWTALRLTALRKYPYSTATVVKNIAAGIQLTRAETVQDTSGVYWTRAFFGTLAGWLPSGDLTPPFRQWIWNRRNPVTQQYTNYWCVPASVQTELNMALNQSSASYSFQKSVYTYGRANMGYRVSGLGLDPQAWQRALGYFSQRRVGYVDATYSSYTSALRAGVVQMRRSGLPVGLLVYYGGHAWTMIGYTATADPLKTSAFTVTGVYVAAPFVRWTDPPAGTYYTASQFARKMTPYYEETRWTRWNGLYTIVIPTG